MIKREKRLRRMRDNLREDWTIEHFKSLAEKYGMKWRQPGTSHVTFVAPNGDMLTVPAHKPVKLIYVKKFVVLLAELETDDV